MSKLYVISILVSFLSGALLGNYGREIVETIAPAQYGSVNCIYRTPICVGSEIRNVLRSFEVDGNIIVPTISCGYDAYFRPMRKEDPYLDGATPCQDKRKIFRYSYKGQNIAIWVNSGTVERIESYPNSTLDF